MYKLPRGNHWITVGPGSPYISQYIVAYCELEPWTDFNEFNQTIGLRLRLKMSAPCDPFCSSLNVNWVYHVQKIMPTKSRSQPTSCSSRQHAATRPVRVNILCTEIHQSSGGHVCCTTFVYFETLQAKICTTFVALSANTENPSSLSEKYKTDTGNPLVASISWKSSKWCVQNYGYSTGRWIKWYWNISAGFTCHFGNFLMLCLFLSRFLSSFGTGLKWQSKLNVKLFNSGFPSASYAETCCTWRN